MRTALLSCPAAGAGVVAVATIPTTNTRLAVCLMFVMPVYRSCVTPRDVFDRLCPGAEPVEDLVEPGHAEQLVDDKIAKSRMFTASAGLGRSARV